nr:hypothetical protein CFP56_60062 [Quercus suber]
MIGFLDESCEAPASFLRDSSGSFIGEPNPEFFNWKNREQALFTFINSTLSPSVLAITMDQKSAKGVWQVLEKGFASVSQSHVLSLGNELLSIKKGLPATLPPSSITSDVPCPSFNLWLSTLLPSSSSDSLSAMSVVFPPLQPFVAVSDVPSDALSDVSSLVTSPSPVIVAPAEPMPQFSLPPT